MRIAHPPNRWSPAAGLVAFIAACLSTLILPTVAAGQWETPAAVYELDQWIVDWSPTHGLTVDAHRIVRVNRSAGAEVGRIRIWDTFFQQLESFQGEVRDTLGRVLYTVGSEAVRAIAPFSGFRLYSGDVIRAVDLVAPQPPYTIEAHWTVKIDNPFFWPDWILADRWPRRLAIYEVRTPPDRAIRHLAVATGLVQSTEHHPRRSVTRWELHDWVVSDSLATEDQGIFPLLHVSPVEYRLGRRLGRTDSWEALGAWYWDLTADRLKLSEAQRRTIDGRVRDLVGDRARAAALKDWVSDQWRYVAIEVGLGGWRPHPAREVFDNRYGDCKDMVYLWVAMMRHVGLAAYPALIRARDPLPIDPTFPKDWFDHVIGVAIINGDTLWADPSDPRYPLGTLPRACEARWALIVTESGGRLVYTPAKPADENRWATQCDGVLDSAGSLEFTIRLLASGHFARRLPLRGGNGYPDDLAALLGISRPSLTATLDGIDVISSDAAVVRLHGRITGWATTGPRQILIRPSFAGWSAADTLAGRPDPGHDDFPLAVADTLVVRMPPGWGPEFWPSAPAVGDTGGQFSERRDFGNGALTVIRNLRSEAAGRSDTERRATARLRAVYRAARTAEWLFRPVPTGPDTSQVPTPR